MDICVAALCSLRTAVIDMNLPGRSWSIEQRRSGIWNGHHEAAGKSISEPSK